MKAPVKCSECGEGVFHRIWVTGRKLRYKCEYCNWMSEPFTPPHQEITAERVMAVSQFGGIEYTVYDQYGHVMTMSRTYYDRDDAIEALQSDLIRNVGSTAVLWPESVIAKGEVFK